MKWDWVKKNMVNIILILILITLGIVLLNWNSISQTETVQTKMKIMKSIQSNELDSARIILEEYLDSL
jgi:predicted negative regulator of RcsB-dependent stress response